MSNQLTEITINKITNVILKQFQTISKFITVKFITIESCFLESK